MSRSRQNQEIAEQFGRNMRRMREGLYMSQREVGKVGGLHGTEISMLERGLRTPRLDTILRLAKALRATPDELTAGINWIEPDEVETATGFFDVRQS